MSFSTKEAEFLEFDRKVRDMEGNVSALNNSIVARIHNELVANCEDYRVIGGFDQCEVLVENTPAGLSRTLPEGGSDLDVVNALFEPGSFTGGLLRGAAFYAGSDYLIRRPPSVETKAEIVEFGPVYTNSEFWRNIVHHLSVFFAIRGKTPQEMFADSIFTNKGALKNDDPADK